MKLAFKIVLPLFFILFSAVFVYTIQVKAQVDAATSPQPLITSSPAQCGLFQDVDASSPFFPYIQCLGCNGSAEGYACNTPPAGQCVPPDNLAYFLPGANISRGQLMKLVAITARFNNIIPSGRQTFADVPLTNPFWEFVEQAYAHGVVSGYPCGGPNEPCDSQSRPYFRPNVDVRRDQAVKMIILSQGASPAAVPSTATFADVPVGSTFFAEIEEAARQGIISGYACGSTGEPCDTQSRPYFRPAISLTRQQAAQLVSLGLNCTLPGLSITPSACSKKTQGDVNCDDVINAVDYFYYVRYENGVRTFPTNVNLDVNGNGTIDVADRTVIVNSLKGTLIKQ